MAGYDNNTEHLNCIEVCEFQTKSPASLSFSGLDMNLTQFKESGFGSLSSFMIRDDIGQLVVGARGKVLTLDLDDITKKTSEVRPLFGQTGLL